MEKDVCVLIFLGLNAWKDWKTKTISLKSVAAFWFLGAVLYGWGILEWRFVQLLGVLPGLFLLFWSWLTGGKVGRGDALIVISLGLYLPGDEVTALFLSALTGAALYSGVIYMRRRDSRGILVPFVPFLLCSYVGGLWLWTR